MKKARAGAYAQAARDDGMVQKLRAAVTPSPAACCDGSRSLPGGRERLCIVSGQFVLPAATDGRFAPR